MGTGSENVMDYTWVCVKDGGIRKEWVYVCIISSVRVYGTCLLCHWNVYSCRVHIGDCDWGVYGIWCEMGSLCSWYIYIEDVVGGVYGRDRCIPIARPMDPCIHLHPNHTQNPQHHTQTHIQHPIPNTYSSNTLPATLLYRYTDVCVVGECVCVCIGM